MTEFFKIDSSKYVDRDGKLQELIDDLLEKGFRFSHVLKDRRDKNGAFYIKKSHIFVYAREIVEGRSDDDVVIRPDDIHKRIKVTQLR